ncbi:hypothetical protein WOLCODRAFT_110154 [Wolfiporia cocos MD-104 SS10]|uniref:Copper-fist domain-containing protein n=1 Tax=Wolfiporia cocos (strain MD-104) TaxID=742152 RepID=A0A2H3J6N5_WOLCO|nr:hypothetical protein WOLCODRAFT_110154 [Wolfiporia cocos MD-104 SS10]
MVFVGDKKYACETCIKGHRSSSCKHTDRPLFEIKKKGRPVTQCEHCRELRKTKQVHVKCMCATRDEGDGPLKRGSTKIPATAAFPSGLPEALEASVALQAMTDGSDSEHSGHGSSTACSCNDTGICNCCTARVSRPKRKSKPRERGPSVDLTASSSRPESQITQPAGLVVNAHTGDYRPVLPRPPSQRQPSPTGPVHDPSTAHGGIRHQLHHGQAFYSPYGRAYEYVHGSEFMDAPIAPSAFQQSVPAMAVPSPSHADTAAISPGLASWMSSLTPPNAPMSACACGSSCACPGCLEHRGASANPSASCTNPHSCMSCLDCAVLMLPSSITGEPSPVNYDDRQQQQDPIDDWLRQVSIITPPALQPPSPLQPMPMTGQPPDRMSPHVPSPAQSDVQFDPSMLQTYALWNNLQDARPSPAAPEECCGGQCKCPAGLCACATDCCGCCQGCQCPGCEHEQGGRSVTFATSGERAQCCSGGRRQPAPAVSDAPWPMEVVRNEQSLDVPRTLSRASSLSSHSSAGQSHVSTSSSLGSALGYPSTGANGHGGHSCCS